MGGRGLIDMGEIPHLIEGVGGADGWMVLARLGVERGDVGRGRNVPSPHHRMIEIGKEEMGSAR